MTTIKTFADELAAVTFTGVVKRFDGAPKVIYPHELPAKWVEMPSAMIEPSAAEGSFGTFAASAARYTTFMFVAVCELSEGLPDDQREAVLDMAERIEAWAILTEKTVEMATQPKIKVAAREYRGITCRVTAPDME